MDAWSSIYGSGVVRAGQGAEISGTSEIVGLLSAAPGIGAEGVISFPPVRGRYLHAGGTQAGGDALRWIADVLGMTIPEALAAAAAAEPQPLLFLPHLAGERAPLWNADARAVFVGMTSHTTPGHLVRAVLEGVAHAARHLRECVRGRGRLPRRHAAPVRRRRRAASCGTRSRPTPIAAVLEQVASTMTGCLGAALMGGVAAGRPATSSRGPPSVVTSPERSPPIRRADRFDRLHAVYRATYARSRTASSTSPRSPAPSEHRNDSHGAAERGRQSGHDGQAVVCPADRVGDGLRGPHRPSRRRFARRGRPPGGQTRTRKAGQPVSRAAASSPPSSAAFLANWSICSPRLPGSRSSQNRWAAIVDGTTEALSTRAATLGKNPSARAAPAPTWAPALALTNASELASRPTALAIGSATSAAARADVFGVRRTLRPPTMNGAANIGRKEAEIEHGRPVPVYPSATDTIGLGTISSRAAGAPAASAGRGRSLGCGDAGSGKRRQQAHRVVVAVGARRDLAASLIARRTSKR